MNILPTIIYCSWVRRTAWSHALLSPIQLPVSRLGRAGRPGQRADHRGMETEWTGDHRIFPAHLVMGPLEADLGRPSHGKPRPLLGPVGQSYVRPVLHGRESGMQDLPKVHLIMDGWGPPFGNAFIDKPSRKEDDWMVAEANLSKVGQIDGLVPEQNRDVWMMTRTGPGLGVHCRCRRPNYEFVHLFERSRLLCYDRFKLLS